ncbi:MAG: hypothetical protein ACOYT8_05505 [Candidatus Dependentiae bacterium]
MARSLLINQRAQGFTLFEFLIYSTLSVVLVGFCLQAVFAIQYKLKNRYYECHCARQANTVYDLLATDYFYANPASMKIDDGKLYLNDEKAFITWFQKGNALYRKYTMIQDNACNTALVANNIKSFCCALVSNKKNTIMIELYFVNNPKKFVWNLKNGWYVHEMVPTA